MFRTADSIEESKAQSVRTPRSSGIGKGAHPNSRKNLLAPWPKGVSGNPGGKPKVDVAAIIARAVLEQNQEEAYKALGKALLKGNAYVFKELAERGYGKLKESHAVEHQFQDIPDADLRKRIAELEGKLGLAGTLVGVGAIDSVAAGTEPTNGETQAR